MAKKKKKPKSERRGLSFKEKKKKNKKNKKNKKRATNSNPVSKPVTQQQKEPPQKPPAAPHAASSKPATPPKVGTSQPHSEQNPYRFLNPYNFVRPLEVGNENVAPLLGRCPPPPHDRYVGLTGRITCCLTAKTPLFVSDSEEIEPTEVAGGKEHHTYRFFRDPNNPNNPNDPNDRNGKIAIPGTSLRGAFRSIFEAVTNSCFSVFDGSRFDLREGRLPQGLRPVRVVEV